MKPARNTMIAGGALVMLGTVLGAVVAVAATNHAVKQAAKSFSTSDLSIATGDSVTFVNDDSVKHNILIKDIDFNSGTQEPGAEVKATFDKSGTFKVRCGIHPKMKMTVVVN